MTKIVVLIVAALTLSACGAGIGFGCKQETKTGYCSRSAP